MPKTVAPLTFTQIEKAKPKDKEYNLSDGGGLYLRIKPNGRKVWLFKYAKPYTKTRTNISLGFYPTISLSAARDKCADAQALLTQNIDPREHERMEHAETTQQKQHTFKAVMLQWFCVKKCKISEDTFYKMDITLRKHLIPELGNVPISELRAQRVIAVLKPIASRNALETVSRLCQRINEIMVFALNTGLIDTNPLAGIKAAFKQPEVRHQLSIRPEELPRLMRALSFASIKLKTRCLIEWQLHTMVRPREAAETRWCEIDADAKLWTIPPERMKKKREHIVPLTDQVIALLKIMYPFSARDGFVFPSDVRNHHPMNSETANRALKRMGFGGVLVSHGLRSIASTALNEHGFDPDLIESALAHECGTAVRRAYNRSEYVERRRPLMDWWSAFIEQATRDAVNLQD